MTKRKELMHMTGDEDILSINQYQDEEEFENLTREERSEKRKALFRDIENRMISPEGIEDGLQVLIDMGRVSEEKESRLEVYGDWMVLLKLLKKEDRTGEVV